jgi:EcsC protein family
MGIARSAARALVPVGMRLAPHVGSGLVRELLVRAIDGAGPFRGAAAAADANLAESGGDRAAAVSALIDRHVRGAGLGGFVTNLGGLVTMAVGIPANVAGLALLQCHLVATIAHLHGYDLNDPRVRNAVLACLLGPNAVEELVRSGDLPSGPMGLATSPVHDPALDTSIAQAVTTELFGRVGGRRMATTIGRRIALLGGGVGAIGDGVSTYRIGRYAERELKARPRSGSAPATAPSP